MKIAVRDDKGKVYRRVCLVNDQKIYIDKVNKTDKYELTSKNLMVRYHACTRVGCEKIIIEVAKDAIFFISMIDVKRIIDEIAKKELKNKVRKDKNRLRKRKRKKCK